MILIGNLIIQTNSNLWKHSSVFAKLVLKISETQKKKSRNHKCWTKIGPMITHSAPFDKFIININYVVCQNNLGLGVSIKMFNHRTWQKLEFKLGLLSNFACHGQVLVYLFYKFGRRLAWALAPMKINLVRTTRWDHTQKQAHTRGYTTY